MKKKQQPIEERDSMKLPQCPKTVTGKHKFIDRSYKVCWTSTNERKTHCKTIKGCIECEYCGLIDDRKEKV